MVNETFFKVLKNGSSCHGGDLKWSLPTQNPDGSWTPGDWHEVMEPLEMCRTGLHLTNYANLYDWYAWGCMAYEVEIHPEAEIVQDSRKIAVSKCRLTKPFPHPDWWVNAVKFVEGLKDTPFLQPDGDPLPEWELLTAPTWVEARDEARNAARDGALLATCPAARLEARLAVRDAARFAARFAVQSAACGSAKNAARDAVRIAARDTERYAAWDAERYAARDAELQVQMIICSDLDIPTHYQEFAKKSWQVWEKGYALYGVVDGKFYVYAQE